MDETSFNCECETDPDARTLSDMREELLTRTGYAAQASNPPPGVAALMGSYLRGAQSYLYRRFRAMQTERFFRWDLLEGIRYYGIADEAVSCSDTTLVLDRTRIRGAWVIDLSDSWYPLRYGINPVRYTLTEKFGWPTHYEVRQCIEVFPAPQVDGYTLMIKGHFGLMPFTDDEHYTTLPPEPVLLWAIGLAKSHKGDRDAGVPTTGRETGYYGMAIAMIKDLIASRHVNRRYVPGRIEIPAPTPPIFLPVQGS